MLIGRYGDPIPTQGRIRNPESNEPRKRMEFDLPSDGDPPVRQAGSSSNLPYTSEYGGASQSTSSALPSNYTTNPTATAPGGSSSRSGPTAYHVPTTTSNALPSSYWTNPTATDDSFWDHPSGPTAYHGTTTTSSTSLTAIAPGDYSSNRGTATTSNALPSTYSAPTGTAPQPSYASSNRGSRQPALPSRGGNYSGGSSVTPQGTLPPTGRGNASRRRRSGSRNRGSRSDRRPGGSGGRSRN